MTLPVLSVLFLAGMGIYALLMGRSAVDLPPARQWRFLASFALGLLAALAILIPSPDLFGPDHRFTVNMAQMLLAVEVSPALLFRGIPPGMLPASGRWRAAVRRLTRPQVTGPVSAVILLGWFVPVLFEAASSNLALWILKQILFLISGLLFWWPLLGPGTAGKPAYTVQLVYVFAMRLPMTALGVLITFANHFLYNSRSFALELCAPSSLSDQQAGGLVMWTAGGLVLFAAFSVVFIRLLKTHDASTPD